MSVGHADRSRDLSKPVSQQAAVAALGQAALLNQDVHAVFSMAVDLLYEVLGVDYAKVLHQPSHGEPFVLMAGQGWQEHIVVGEATVPYDRDSQAGYALLQDDPIYVDDLALESRFAGSRLLLDHDVASGMSVVIQGKERPYGVLGVHSRLPRHFKADEGDFLRSIANILSSTIENKRFVEQAEQRARYETALAECAQALLASSGEDRIQHALEALIAATEATWVFLERNVVDPELGLCSKTVAEVARGPAEPGVEEEKYWNLVPWEQMPISRSHMEEGRPFVLMPDDLDGPERDLYMDDPFPVKTELDIPIFVEGKWAGLIGFSDQTIERHWSESDLSLLSTAAKMIGAFWERDQIREGLVEVNRAKDAFLASVSHELRTPLTAVVGFGQLLQESERTMGEEERAQLLEMVVAQSMDLTNITNDLLVAAKADIGTLEVISVAVDLRAQAAQVLEAFEQNQVGHIKLIGESVRATGDPDRVRQIIRNLISNALRYGGATCRLEVLADEKSAKLLVFDSGRGVPPEDRERIFEPYQRAHSAHGITDSLGLGLAISRQLARLMGGDLTYSHQDGESVFAVSLPLFA